MESQDTVKPAQISYKEEEQLERNYELTLDNDTYLLTMTTMPEDKINYKIRQTNNICFYFYENTFKYAEIAKILLLEKNYYDCINKVFKFYDTAINKNKVSLSHGEKGNTLTLSLKKQMDFDEVECRLDLFEKTITNESMLRILFNEIREMKLNNSKINNNNDLIKNENSINEINAINDKENEYSEMIKKLIKKNEELERKINSIIDENIILKNSISELQNAMNELKQKNEEEEKEKITEEESNYKSQNIDVNFYGNPQNLEYYDTLTINHTKSGWLREFVVYTGLLDNVEYLIFNDKKNYNLVIMRIIDKNRINSLKGHKAQVPVMRYFIQNNSKEYLLSCDESRLVICWDLQQYTQFLKIPTNYSGFIWDALIMFDVLDKNYLFIPSYDSDEFTKVYEFKETSSFVKNINGTNENKTNFLIPWYHRNNYYLIECCSSKISINNILKDENYATLIKQPEGLHCCGYIYDKNYLCVTDYNHNFIRIWNLDNKTIYKTIEFEASLAYGIIHWNNIYSIVACSGCLAIIDIKQEKMVGKITLKKNKANFCGIKKLQISKLGECLICSDNNNNIRIFNII